MFRFRAVYVALFVALTGSLIEFSHAAEKKRVVMIAGTKSHGYGSHEHKAGCLLLKRCLDEGAPNVETVVYTGGWPKDPAVLKDADVLVLYMDGGGRHPVNNRLEEVDRLMKRGVGLVCIHYAVEVPKGKPGAYFLDWIGGYFEVFWSVNPHWTMEKPQLAAGHPITRGVKPFTANDEWYYHMRFRPEMKGVTPILSAVPPERTRRDVKTARGGNPDVLARKGMYEVAAWARQRPDGGRGFGFTGGHVHWNWGNDQVRKLVLNAIVWTAGGEVPKQGVVTKTPTLEQLEANQDYPQPANFDREKIIRMLKGFKETGAAK